MACLIRFNTRSMCVSKKISEIWCFPRGALLFQAITSERFDRFLQDRSHFKGKSKLLPKSLNFRH